MAAAPETWQRPYQQHGSWQVHHQRRLPKCRAAAVVLQLAEHWVGVTTPKRNSSTRDGSGDMQQVTKAKAAQGVFS